MASKGLIVSSLSWLSCVCLLACSSASSDGSSPAPTAPAPSATHAPPAAPAPTDAPAPKASYPAFKVDPVLVVSRGGTPLKAPKVQAILFDGDSPGEVVDTFLQKVGASTYWAATTSEYGVGALTALPAAHITEPAPATIDDAAIKTWLATELDGTHAGLTADPSTIYVIVYPEGTVVTRAGGASCGAFGGYHAEAKLAAGSATYVVVPRCSMYANQFGADELTFVASHELVEATLNPTPTSAPAYDRVDDEHLAFLYAFEEAEAGDLCVLYSTRPADLDFTVQRTWSNAASKAGHHPCVPAPNGPFFATAPVLPDTFTLQGTSFPVVDVPVGQSKTIELQLFSDMPAADWSFDALDVAKSIYGRPAELSFSFERTKGNNGDVVKLTITSLAKGKANAVSGLSGFIVRSGSGTHITSLWAGFVAN